MKIKAVVVLGIMILSVVTGASCAYATNWVYVARDSKVLNAVIYIDADSVAEENNTITYWELIIYDHPNVFGDKKDIWKWQVSLTPPRQHKILQYHAYDIENMETYQNDTMNDFNAVEVGSIVDNEIDMALSYAKEGASDGVAPTL